MHVNVHFSWLLVGIAGDIKEREKRGNEIKSIAHNKELPNVFNATSGNCFYGCIHTSTQPKPLEPLDMLGKCKTFYTADARYFFQFINMVVFLLHISSEDSHTAPHQSHILSQEEKLV